MNRLKKIFFQLKTIFTQNKPLFVSAFVTLWMGVAFFVFQQVTFETNDDNGMARIIYGLGTTYYDPHLVYINVLLGYVMKAFLLVFPNVAWYTIFQCVLVLASFFVILYLIFSRFGVRKGMLPALLFVFFFGAEFCLKLQFSKTAGIAAVAGVLLLFDTLRPHERRPYWKWIVGGLLTVLGSLYRFNSFGMVLVPMIGIGVVYLLKPLLAKNWKRVLQICLPFVVVFATCFACRMVNTAVYQSSEEWASYKEINSLRSQLLDYGFPSYEANKELYTSLGISALDLEVFRTWDFVDPEVLSVDAMRQLVEAKQAPPFVWKDCLENLYDFFFSYWYSFSILFAVLVAFFISKSKRLLLTLYALGAVVALQFYLYSSGRYGLNRIDAVLALVLFAVIIIYGWAKPLINYRAVSGFLAVLLLLAPFNEFKEKEPPLEPVPLYELMYSTPDRMYMRSLTTPTTLIPRSFEMYPVGYQRNYSSFGGWGAYSVPYLEKLERFNITNPFRDMVDHPDMFLIADQIQVELRVNYIRAHYAPEAVGRLVKVTEDNYSFYRVTTQLGPTLDTSKAIPANGRDDVHYGLSAKISEGRTAFNGYLYKNNENSFGADVYLGITDSSGNEQIYYTTQRYSVSFGDLMNGEYGAFSTSKVNLDPHATVKLYLQTEDELYCVEMGTLWQIIAFDDYVYNH